MNAVFFDKCRKGIVSITMFMRFIAMIFAPLLISGCYDQDDSGIIKVHDITGNSIAFSVEDIRLKKTNGNGPNYYYASQSIDIDFTSGGIALQCPVNIKNPNNSNNRLEQDSEIVATKCDDKSNQVVLDCRPGKNDKKSMECHVSGLVRDELYSIAVSSRISHMGDSLSDTKAKTLQLNKKIRTLPEIETKIFEKNNGDQFLIKLSNKSRLMISPAARSTISNATESGFLEKMNQAYKPILVDEILDETRYHDFVITDYNKDGAMDILAVTEDGVLSFLENQSASTATKFVKLINVENVEDIKNIRNISKHVINGVNEYIVSGNANPAVTIFGIEANVLNVAKLNIKSSIEKGASNKRILFASGAALNQTNASSRLIALTVQNENFFEYNTCILTDRLITLDECVGYESDPLLYEHVLEKSWNKGKADLAIGTAKVLAADFNGDGLTDILQVREGIVRVQKNNQFNAVYKKNAATNGNGILNHFNSNEISHASDFMQGLPAVRDAFPISSNCFPAELNASIIKNSNCHGLADNRFKPIYKDALDKGLAVGGYFGENGSHAHRWQLLNTDGELLDIDNDGDVDVVMQIPSYGAVVFLNQGDGRFMKHHDYPISARNDGKADIFYNGSLLGKQVVVSDGRDSINIFSEDLIGENIYAADWIVSDGVKRIGQAQSWFNSHEGKSGIKIEEYLRSRIVNLLDPKSVDGLWSILKSGDLLKIENAFATLEKIKLRERTDKLIEIEANKKISEKTQGCKSLHDLSDEAALNCALILFGSEQATAPAIDVGLKKLQMWWGMYPHGQYLKASANALLTAKIIHPVEKEFVQSCADASDSSDEFYIKCLHTIEEYHRGVLFVEWNDSIYEKHKEIAHDVQWSSYDSKRSQLPPSCWGVDDKIMGKYSAVGVLIPTDADDDFDTCLVSSASQLIKNGFPTGGPLTTVVEYSEYLTRSVSPRSTIALAPGVHVAVVLKPDTSNISLGTLKSVNGEFYCDAIGYSSPQLVKLGSPCHFVARQNNYMWSAKYTGSLNLPPNGMVNFGNIGDNLYLCKKNSSDSVSSADAYTFKFVGNVWLCVDKANNKIVNYHVLINQEEDELIDNNRRMLEAADDKYKKITYQSSDLPALSNFTTWIRTLTNEADGAAESKVYFDKDVKSWSIGSRNIPDQLVLKNLNLPVDKQIFSLSNSAKSDSSPTSPLGWHVLPVAPDSSYIHELNSWVKKVIFRTEIIEVDPSTRYTVVSPSGKILKLSAKYGLVKNVSNGKTFDVTDRIDLFQDEDYRMVYRLSGCSAVTNSCTWLLDAAALSREQQEVFFIRDVTNKAALLGVAEFGCLSQAEHNAADFSQLVFDSSGNDVSLKRRTILNAIPDGIHWLSAIHNPRVTCNKTVRTHRMLGLMAPVAIFSVGASIELAVPIVVAGFSVVLYDDIKNWLNRSDDFYRKDRDVVEVLYKQWGGVPFSPHESISLNLDNNDHYWSSKYQFTSQNQEAIAGSNDGRKKHLSRNELDKVINDLVNKDFSKAYVEPKMCEGINYDKSWPFDVSRAEVSKRAHSSYALNGYINWNEVLFDQYHSPKMLKFLTAALEEELSRDESCAKENPLAGTIFEPAFVALKENSKTCWAIDTKKFTNIFQSSHIVDFVKDNTVGAIASIPRNLQESQSSIIPKVPNIDNNYMPPKWSNNTDKGVVKSEWIKQMSDMEKESYASGLKAVMPFGVLRLRLQKNSEESVHLPGLVFIRTIDVDITPPTHRWKLNPDLKTSGIDDYFNNYWEQPDRVKDRKQYMQFDCAENPHYKEDKTVAVCFVEHESTYSFSSKVIWEFPFDIPGVDSIAYGLVGGNPLQLVNQNPLYFRNANRIDQENICHAFGRFILSRYIPGMNFGVAFSSGISWGSDYSERFNYAGTYVGAQPRTFGGAYAPDHFGAMHHDNISGWIPSWVASKTEGRLGFRTQVLDEATFGFGVNFVVKNCHLKPDCSGRPRFDDASHIILAIGGVFPFNSFQFSSLTNMVLRALSLWDSSTYFLPNSSANDYELFYGFYWDARPWRAIKASGSLGANPVGVADYGVIVSKPISISVFPFRLTGAVMEWGKHALPPKFEANYIAGPE